MRILVTGGAGFIGSQVTKAYAAAGHDVAVIDNLSSGLRTNLSDKVQFFEADIRDASKVKQFVAKFRPEILNHHAAHLSVSESVQDPRSDADINLLGFLTIIEAARPYLKRVIVASSGGVVYGDAQQIPTPESHPTAPISPYGVAKLAMEQYLHFYHVQYGLEWVGLRYANVYGPYQNPKGETGVIAVFLDQIANGVQPRILGDGKQTRDYVFVRDVVAANVCALEHGRGAYNIGTGIETSVIELFGKLQVAFGTSLPEIHGPARPGEQQRSSLDAARASEELGWKPGVDLADGLGQTVAWYKQAFSSNIEG